MIERIYKALIPDDIDKDIMRSSYAKNLIGACIVSFLASILYAALYLYLDFHEAAYAILLNEIILLTPLLIVKYYRSLYLASMVYACSIALLIGWLTYYLGGLFTTTAYWFTLPGLMAAYIGGIRQGYFWAAVSLVCVAVIFTLQKFGFPFPVSPVTDPLLLQFIGISGLIVVIVTMIYFYEKNISDYLIKLHYIAYQDLLTNLPNRMAYQEMLVKSIDNAKRKRTNFSIVCINIDNFEKINAIFGHDIGDNMLFQIPQRIKRHMPYAHMMARINGDEFKIIVEATYEDIAIREMGDFFLATLRIPYHINNHEIRITASIGIATYHFDRSDNLHIDRYVDLALMKAKKLGGNNYQYFNEQLAHESALQVAIERSLPTAIENNELNLNFQLIFDAKEKKKVCGFEVLLRWRSPVLGDIQPAIFIPIAEKIDLISKLDDWVLKQACKIYRQWQDEGLVNDDIPFSANLSPQQLYDVNFIETIDNTLKTSGVAPKNVILELTETAIISDQARAIAVLGKLAEMGVSTVIDDFGVGYTSLSYLSTLPVKGLKIDKLFVHDMMIQDKKYDVIIQSIIELAHKLNLKVVSEGVETDEQLDFLNKLNCDHVQGFYLGKPLDMAAMHTFLHYYKKSRD